MAGVVGEWLSAAAPDRTKVAVNGSYVRVLRASPRRVDFVCPELAPGTPISVSLESPSGEARPLTAIMPEAAPGIFTVDGTGEGQGMVLFQGTSTVAMARNPRVLGQPAQPGDRVAIRMTGLPPQAQPLVRLGDMVIPAQSVEPVDGNPGIWDVLVTLPSGVVAGDAVPVAIQLVQAGGQITKSNTVTIAVEPVRP